MTKTYSRDEAAKILYEKTGVKTTALLHMSEPISQDALDSLIKVANFSNELWEHDKNGGNQND